MNKNYLLKLIFKLAFVNEDLKYNIYFISYASCNVISKILCVY